MNNYWALVGVMWNEICDVNHFSLNKTPFPPPLRLALHGCKQQQAGAAEDDVISGRQTDSRHREKTNNFCLSVSAAGYRSTHA